VTFLPLLLSLRRREHQQRGASACWLVQAEKFHATRVNVANYNRSGHYLIKTVSACSKRALCAPLQALRLIHYARRCRRRRRCRCRAADTLVKLHFFAVASSSGRYAAVSIVIRVLPAYGSREGKISGDCGRALLN